MNAFVGIEPLQVSQEGETDIVVRRSFNHPPERVWRAMTDPALIPKWMASVDAMTRCEMDLREGGSFLYQWGDAFYFSGPILEVQAPHHLKHVEHFNGDGDYETNVTTDLKAHGTGTRMTIVMRYANAQARADAIEAGMTHGFDDVYNRLDAVVAEI